MGASQMFVTRGRPAHLVVGVALGHLEDASAKLQRGLPVKRLYGSVKYLYGPVKNEYGRDLKNSVGASQASRWASPNR